MTAVGDAIIAAQRARAAGEPPPTLPVAVCVALYTEPRRGSKIRMLDVLARLFDHDHEQVAKALRQQGIRLRRHDRDLLATREAQNLQRHQDL